MIKQLFIPVALFAISATSASAYTGNPMIENLDLGLSSSQKAALEQAHEVRSTSKEEAKKILQDAGIDAAKLKEIRGAVRSEMRAHFAAVKEAVTNNNYSAFKTAVAGTPMAEKVATEADFAKLVQAQTLFKSGDKEGAKTIMNELGFDHIGAIAHRVAMHRGMWMRPNQ